jgi:GNAT superfamily N-acetyltransferase
VTDSPEHMQIEYGVYAPSDAETMAKLMGEVFSRYDPPAVAVGLTASEFEAFVRLLCPKAAVEGLTIVARLAGTGELIGALLTEDSASAPPDGIDRLSPKFDSIFNILGQLDAEYRGGQVARPGESLHLFLLGVSDRVAGRGVAQQLVAACLEHGRAQVIAWPSPRRRTRRPSTSFASRDSSRAYSGLMRPIASTDGRFLRRSLSTAARY